MKPLSTLDTVFASLETSRWPLHGGGVLVLNPATSKSSLSFTDVLEHLRRALPDLPPMRRRLIQVPLGFSDPYWLEDPDFNLERHLHRIAVPAPGDTHSLQELISQLGDPPLDFSKPLWEIWYIEGLENGRVALYIKMHHACVDGMGGLAMLRALFTESPEDLPVVSVDSWVPDRVPSQPEVVLRSLPATVVRNFRAAGAIAGMTRALAPGLVSGLVKPQRTAAPSEGDARVGLFAGPTVPLSTVTPGQLRRSMGWVSIPLADIKRVREIHGGTLNDVALAMCGGALRSYMVKRGHLPEQSLTAINPVNMRSEGPEGEPRNNFSLLLTSLHTEVEDSVERLDAISRRMTRTKSSLRKVKRNPVEDIFTILTPGVVSGLANLASTALPDIKAPANVCVTNVAFTPVPLYFAGAEVEEFYVMMMQSLGLGLVFALLSYNGQLHLSITANRDAVDDPQEIADSCLREIENLLAAGE